MTPCPITADRDEWRTADLRGALAAIIADPDCCAASKAIARGALREEALTELVQLGQEAGDYGAPEMREDRQQAEASFKAREDALVEALGEALHGLSAMLLLTGALDDDKTHAAYEKVVARFQPLARAHTAADAGGE